MQKKVNTRSNLIVALIVAACLLMCLAGCSTAKYGCPDQRRMIGYGCNR